MDAIATVAAPINAGRRQERLNMMTLSTNELPTNAN
jgi:hypothetical protein